MGHELNIGARNIVVIGASAGGVQALTALFEQIDPETAASFLVVLHIPAYEPSALHSVLSRATNMRVIAAKGGEPIEAGTIYVASPDRHLMVDEHGVRLTRGPKECRVRPAIDVLFRSAAVNYGPRAIGVILTGALDDGTAGLWAVKDRGGLALVQDPKECLISSMAESAIRHVTVDFVGPLAALARQISEAVGARVGNAWVGPRYDSLAIENSISIKGNGLETGVLGLGKISHFTCPDCHGVLVQIEEGSIVRFRCHTGHAFSMRTLIHEINSAIDTGLWDTLRAVEERIVLLRQMADLSEGKGLTEEAEECRRQADEAERRLGPLRKLVLDPTFFGHDQART